MAKEAKRPPKAEACLTLVSVSGIPQRSKNRVHKRIQNRSSVHPQRFTSVQARLVHQTGTAFAILLISKKQDNMSDTAKDTVTPKDKDGAEKRGRGRPRKHPQEPSGSPTPKRPRGRPKGSKNKAGSTAPKGKKAAAATASAGGKRRGRPKKAEKEEQPSKSSEEEEEEEEEEK
ncbi:hypothetical protein MHYP_G00080740 [Metynnis hypsauchen]